MVDDEPGPTRLVYRPTACAYESQWFEQPFVRPSEQVVDSSIPEKFLNIFQDLIWNKPHDRMVPGYGNHFTLLNKFNAFFVSVCWILILSRNYENSLNSKLYLTQPSEKESKLSRANLTLKKIF